MCGRFLLGFLLVKHPDFFPSFFLQLLSEKLCSPLAFYPICSDSLEVNNCFVPPPTGIHSYQRSAVQSVRSTFLPLSLFPPSPSDLPPLPLPASPSQSGLHHADFISDLGWYQLMVLLLSLLSPHLSHSPLAPAIVPSQWLQNASQSHFPS